MNNVRFIGNVDSPKATFDNGVNISKLPVRGGIDFSSGYANVIRKIDEK